MVGMGACIGQELAYARPDLARSLVMTGTWAYADPIMVDQLDSNDNDAPRIWLLCLPEVCCIVFFSW